MSNKGPQCIEFLDELEQLKLQKSTLFDEVDSFVSTEHTKANFSFQVKGDRLRYKYGRFPTLKEKVEEARTKIRSKKHFEEMKRKYGKKK